MRRTAVHYSFFFFNDTATTEIYTLSLHDALPILGGTAAAIFAKHRISLDAIHACRPPASHRFQLPEHFIESLAEIRQHVIRSEEHTSELQSRPHLVCRLLLEKKKLHWQTCSS